MNLEDLPVVGRVVGVLGSLGGLTDLLLGNGEVVLSLAWAALSMAPDLVPLLLSVERLSARLPWLDAGGVDTLITVAIAASLTYTVVRLGKKLIFGKQTNES